MNHLTAGTNDARERKVVSPLIDIHETDKEIRLEAEMPGLERESLDLQLLGNELTIRGARKPEAIPEGYALLYGERHPLEYSRTFVLGTDVSREGIDAQYENGVLTVTIPRVAAQQPKRITIS